MNEMSNQPGRKIGDGFFSQKDKKNCGWVCSLGVVLKEILGEENRGNDGLVTGHFSKCLVEFVRDGFEFFFFINQLIWKIEKKSKN